MLRSVRSIIGYRVIGTDRAAGKLLNTKINISKWRISEFNAVIGSFFNSKKVKIPSISVKRPLGETGMLPVEFTREQLKKELPNVSLDNNESSLSRKQGVALISFDSLMNLQAHALDGKAAILSDLIVDDENWHIEYLVIQLLLEDHNHLTLVSTNWVSGVHLEMSSISMNLSIRELVESPEYNPNVPINRDIEGKLYNYYGQPFKKYNER